MTSRVVGPVVVKSGPAPSERPRRGRAGKWSPIYQAINTMRPGEWFTVPLPADANKNHRVDCVSSIRGWLKANQIEGVEVYRDESDSVIVRAK